ncbi:MAG: carboxypeptidase regulatory-like domain-containing protein [Candidatus Omnitrophica bacterium]|nr:carboxypeptidase regulatory-like domain-containing protein [Candidatus Omnitrophota bacterium]
MNCLRLKKFFMVIFLFFFLSNTFVFAVEQTKSHTFINAVEWSLGQKDPPSTYWSPYLCPGGSFACAGLRYKVGLRFQLGSVILKDDVKINFIFDNAQAKAGETLKIKVKPELLGDRDYNTFYSLFGASFPNEVQVGVVGVDIPGLGTYDLLPWYTLPIDYWNILSLVSVEKGGFSYGVGGMIKSAMENINVEMQSKEALPLGESKEFCDRRTLISVSLADLLRDNAKKTEVMTQVWNKIPNSLKNAAIGVLKTVKKLNEQQATTFLCDGIMAGVSGMASLGSLSIVGDPCYKVTGESLVVLVRYWVPGKTSGNYPITFDKNNIQNGFELSIRLPIFIEDNDNLFLTVESITYNFKVEQILRFKVKISVLPDINLVDTTKVMVYTQTSKTFGENIFKLSLPVAKSDQTILDYKVKTSSDSATVWWASPNVLLKGTVKVFKGNEKVAEKTEANFTTSHQVMFTGLLPATEYTFKTTCVDSQGNNYPELTTTQRTLARPAQQSFETQTSYSLPYENYDLEYPKGTALTQLTMSYPQITATADSITFNWTTNVPASTEVFLGVSQDFSTNYVGYIKKANGNIDQGYYGSSGGPAGRELVTNHQITITGLAADTTYYFAVRSWTFATNYYKTVKVSDGLLSDQYTQKKMTVISTDDNAFCYQALGYVGNIKTKPLPVPEVFVISVKDNLNNPVANIPVILTKQAEQAGQVFLTNAEGITSQIPLQRGVLYTASVNNHIAFQDKQIQFAFPQSGQIQNTQVIQLTRKLSPGGYVYDTNGRPVQDAAIELFAGTQQIARTSTDNTGHYTFEAIPTGNYRVKVSKANYLPEEANASSDMFQIFSSSAVVLRSALAKLNISVTAGGKPLANTEVQIKKVGSGELIQNIISDAEGKATVQIPLFSSGSSQVLVIVPASANKKINEEKVIVNLEPGIEEEVRINCLIDNQPPEIINFEIKQLATGDIRISFASNKPGSKFAISYYKPNGQLIETPWQDNGVFGIGKDNPEGTYRIKARIKDMLDNVAETEFVDFVYFKQNSLALSVSNITSTSAVIQWNKYPRQQDFGKYKLEISHASGNRIIEITDIDTTSYALTGLEPSDFYAIRPYHCSVTVIDKSGAVVTSSGVDFRTLPPEPLIQQFIINPSFVSATDNFTISAQIISQGDFNRKVMLYLDKESVPFHTQFGSGQIVVDVSRQAPDKKGKHIIRLVVENDTFPGRKEEMAQFIVSSFAKPRINKEEIPNQIFVNKPANFSFVLLNPEEAGEKRFSYIIDWGDGTKEEDNFSVHGSKTSVRKTKNKEIVFGLAHTYAQLGNYNISLLVKSLTSEGSLQSDPLIVPIQVVVEPPIVELNRQNTDAAEQTFTIKAKSNSYPIKNWQFDFGNGQQTSGIGQVDTTLSATYSIGDYGVVFTVTTEGDNKTYTKQLNFRVRKEAQPVNIQKPNLPMKTTSNQPFFSQEQVNTGSNKTEESVDVAIEKVQVSEEIFWKEKASINVSVKNNCQSEIRECSVIVQSDDGWQQEKEITLKPQETSVLEFFWQPNQLGKQRIQATVNCPDDNNKRNNKGLVTVEVKRRESFQPQPQSSTQQIVPSKTGTSSQEEAKTEKTVDVSVLDMRIPSEFFVGESATIDVIIKNNSQIEIKNIPVIFEAEEGTKQQKVIYLGPSSKEKLRFQWTPKQEGRQKISVSSDYKDDINPRDNCLIERIEVKSVEQKVSISLRSITLEKEIKKDVLEIKSPLVIIAEINSSGDLDVPLDVRITVKSRVLKETFTEKIERLNKGTNKFRWQILQSLEEPGEYALRVEVFNPNLNIRESQEKVISVVEEVNR